MARVHVGTSGWKYPRWRGDFYPEDLPRSDELSYLSLHVNSTEINGSFYSLQSPSRYQAWRDATGADFSFSVKGSRYITHLKRLRDPRPGMSRFIESGPFTLGPKLAAFLWQLPPNLQFDPSLLRGFLDVLPPGRHALEARHASFRDIHCTSLLREHNVALVCADSAGRFPYYDEPTADFMYVRLHGPTDLYRGTYRPDLVKIWAQRIRSWLDQDLDVMVYFDNDSEGDAPWDAAALARLLRVRGVAQIADSA